MNEIEIDARTKIVAATFLLRVALQALKNGSDDPESNRTL
jgi:hypothetical protein